VAQEIALLTPSVQDRSLLPTCYVVLGDPPADFKAMFRKWKPQPLAQQSLCVRVEDVLKEVGLVL